jgi:drug/metabolite transporter (DMT)-like permease
MVGVVILASTDFRFAPGHFSGDIVCFISMLLFTFYLCLSKRNNPKAYLWVYLVPLYLVGGIFCFFVSFAFVNPFTAPITTTDLIMIAALALGPTMIGHSIMNFSMTVLRPQTVSLINLSQFVFAGIMGLIFFGEVPGPIFYVTGFFMVAGVAVIILFGKRPSFSRVGKT